MYDSKSCLDPMHMSDSDYPMIHRADLFDKLKDDVLVLYEQFSVAEPKINPWLWPTDSYAKTQIYKAAHFLSLFYEARLREANDLLKVAVRAMENEQGVGRGTQDGDMEVLD